MITELTPERLAEIEREAKELFPETPQPYISAATKYALLIEQERERAGKLVEALEKWALAKDEFDSGYSNKSGTMTRVNIGALSSAMTGAQNNLHKVFNQYKQSI